MYTSRVLLFARFYNSGWFFLQNDHCAVCCNYNNLLLLISWLSFLQVLHKSKDFINATLKGWKVAWICDGNVGDKPFLLLTFFSNFNCSYFRFCAHTRVFCVSAKRLNNSLLKSENVSNSQKSSFHYSKII